MAPKEDEAVKLLSKTEDSSRASLESTSSASTMSLVLERIGERVSGSSAYAAPSRQSRLGYSDDLETPVDGQEKDDFDLENGPPIPVTKSSDRKFRRGLWIVAGCFIGVWLLAAAVYMGSQASRSKEHDPSATATIGTGKKVTLDQVMGGQWRARKHGLNWIEGANGEDGLLLEQGESGKDYLVVESVRGKDENPNEKLQSITLMKEGHFTVGNQHLMPSRLWPSRDLKKVLIATNIESNWRHSFYAHYWVFDVETQTAEPLDHGNMNGRVQLASWSPQSDAVVFTRDNNMFLRKLSSQDVVQITEDGGSELFYGIPDWVYEEEVFSGNSATWWAEDGEYVAFLRTDESAVPEYPIQYFLSRPSGTKPKPGEEAYPEVLEIKYPKAGAPNPTVRLQFYDVSKGDVFEVKISDEFPDDDRLITEVVWAGSSGKVIIRETNRESDILRVVLIDVKARSGKTVRTTNVAELDGGWFEVSQDTRYIPADPANGRPEDGYIDTIVHDNFDHLAYFSPLSNPDPMLLTSGKWEVVTAPSAVDLKNNLVYFVATKDGSTQRHVYSVKLDGTDLQAMTDTSNDGYYSASFSSGSSLALLSYDGPGIPWQKVVSTRSASYDFSNTIEENSNLATMAKKHELPIKIFSTINIDGFELNVVERRPPHFSEKKKYPVLFYLYGGPASQQVDRKWTVDFQSYVASSLGYIVVTVDGRGTGFLGRETRCIIRGNIGHYEARDQIETAKIWAAKKYVDASRIAIWGWSYGGFMTLKTLEQDVGETFSYGMAVAPVTDWRFYDSIYTERYMHTPQHNPNGYENSTITDMAALSKNVRFLVMHGIADDNVHTQSTYTLLDRLDMAGVENYDVHVFPDSDHGIYFHNANRIVYDKLNNWLINAFNGEWLRTSNATPLDIDAAIDKV